MKDPRVLIGRAEVTACRRASTGQEFEHIFAMSEEPMEKEFVIRECIGILRNPDYLSDDVVRVCFEGMKSQFDDDDILLVAPSVSFVLAETDKEGAEMVMQKMGLSGKNIIIFPMNGDGGSHWSTLVYFRSMSTFVHHDSMRGQNNDCATRLYEVASAFLSSHLSSTKPSSSSSSSNKSKGRLATKDKNSKNKKNPQRPHQSSDLPAFMECETMPQQENGFDCGLYVLAIARAVCMWWSVGGRSRGQNAIFDWFSTMKQHVTTQHVECAMRSQVLEFFEDYLRGITDSSS